MARRSSPQSPQRPLASAPNRANSSLRKSAHFEQLGVDPHRLQVMEGRGLVERVSRGVFRFADVPVGALDQYMEAVLWPFPATGVLSHETALDLHDLCDVNPSRIHVIVPAGYRTTRDVPPLFELHREDLLREEIGWHDGIPIVSARRAIRGSIENHVGWNLIDQAITTARRRGRITTTEARQLKAMRPERQTHPVTGRRALARTAVRVDHGQFVCPACGPGSATHLMPAHLVRRPTP